jgi:hypothetical protein
MEAQDLADDLLSGFPAIAEFTGWPERRVYYLAEKKLIPLFKIGDRWHGRNQHFDAISIVPRPAQRRPHDRWQPRRPRGPRRR